MNNFVIEIFNSIETKKCLGNWCVLFGTVGKPWMEECNFMGMAFVTFRLKRCKRGIRVICKVTLSITLSLGLCSAPHIPSS
jgi:hypothetical protein